MHAGVCHAQTTVKRMRSVTDRPGNRSVFATTWRIHIFQIVLVHCESYATGLFMVKCKLVLVERTSGEISRFGEPVSQVRHWVDLAT